tara:strand:+ start:450 stop:785 length:336 start_codon:yes stop_codon:yes gene_type:complete
MKRVVVTLTDADARVLKLYAAKWNLTLSQALEEMSRSHIHGSADVCTFARDLLANENISIDKRSSKECFGFKCRCCAYTLQCRTGLYQGDWIIDDCYKHLLIENENENHSH